MCKAVKSNSVNKTVKLITDCNYNVKLFYEIRKQWDEFLFGVKESKFDYFPRF